MVQRLIYGDLKFNTEIWLSNLLNAVIPKPEACNMPASHIMWEGDIKMGCKGLE
jgi:hypothetical protein